jgi:3-phosphoshikimate 1-carboxyvinyltransferase
MSFAVAGAVATHDVRIGDCANVATSFPGFLDLANAHGLAVR